jgi:hypothetical protein
MNVIAMAPRRISVAPIRTGLNICGASGSEAKRAAESGRRERRERREAR